jgi:hypothetical protein
MTAVVSLHVTIILGRQPLTNQHIATSMLDTSPITSPSIIITITITITTIIITASTDHCH